MQLDMGCLNLLHMLAGIVHSQQRRGLQPALLGGGRETAIGTRCILTLSPQLLPNKAQEEVAQGVGVQSSGIVGRGGLDEPVALEGFGDAVEVGVVEAVLGDTSEQQEGFERSVRRRRSIHAPDSTPRGTEGTAAALDKMNRRHDLRVPGPVSDPVLFKVVVCTAARQFRSQKHIPAARARRSSQFGRWNGVAAVVRFEGWRATARVPRFIVSGRPMVSRCTGDEILRSRWC